MVSGADTSATPGRSASRGRIDKRQAILDAAMRVFAREGYAQAGMDAIAAEAGVAKPTVYNHFGDKENLFRQAIAADSGRALARNMAVVEQLRGDGELHPMLEEVGFHLLQCYCDDRSWALRRLLYAELGKFPDLIDIVRGRAADRVTEARRAAAQLRSRRSRRAVRGAAHRPDGSAGQAGHPAGPRRRAPRRGGIRSPHVPAGLRAASRLDE